MLFNEIKDYIATRKAGYRERLSAQTYNQVAMGHIRPLATATAIAK
jgi:hypothetical protein